MRFRIDLKIFIFLAIFYFTNQLNIYIWTLIFCFIHEIGHLISKIDISDDKNYTLILETEGKTVYLGDCSELNTRILYLKSILEQEKGVSGELFLNEDLNEQKVHFKPSI